MKTLIAKLDSESRARIVSRMGFAAEDATNVMRKLDELRVIVADGGGDMSVEDFLGVLADIRVDLEVLDEDLSFVEGRVKEGK